MSEHIMAHRLEQVAATENPLESLRSTLAFSSADWADARELAWIYGIVCGWDDEDDPDDGAMDELAARYGWTSEGVARLRRLHDAFNRLADEEASR